MKTILTIMKKELDRVFKDKKLVLMTFLFPGLMIFVMYSFMGSALQNLQTEDEDVIPIVYVENIPTGFQAILDDDGLAFEAEYRPLEDITATQEMLKSGDIDFIIIFPSTFDADIQNGDKPNVVYYYNSGENKSLITYNVFSSSLAIYENQLILDKFGDTDIFTAEEEIIVDESQIIGSVMAMMLPFLIITFLFQGAMSLGPESIAGEKERGTISTLLITPTNRSHIALGKIFSLSILASLSAISSFIGIILSLPKLMGVTANTNIYGFREYILVFIVLIVTVLVIIGLVSNLSALAKNIKEASMIVLPVYLISMFIGLTSMFSSSAVKENILYCIPIFNSVQILTQIFTFEVNTLQFILMLVSNIILASILSFILTRMFHNERVMLTK
ncbi:MAG: ABC transporter permease [Bacilli bacterium]|nr:ABC transporter permease [Bacilli bacterium]